MSGEKTELPTPKKLRDARNKGQVANSKDVGSTALLVALFVYFLAAWDWMFQILQEMLVLPAEFYNQPFGDALHSVLDGVVGRMLQLLLPLLGLMMAIGVAANFFQVGALLVFEPVKPDLSKLNPVSKLKQMFSMKNFMEFVKSTFKVIFLSVLIYLVIREAIPSLMMIPYSGLPGVMSILKAVMFQVAIYTSLAYGVIAVFDFAFQKYQHAKGLMMSKDEVKREFKEMEGDPTIKGKRKQLHREMVMSDTVEKVKKSTVLVTNPTHYAVAIQYEQGETPLPLVLAKGEGLLAKRMIEVAKREGIPIMQNVPLARSLYADGDVNQYIPKQFIEPVAEVLRWVQQLGESV